MLDSINQLFYFRCKCSKTFNTGKIRLTITTSCDEAAHGTHATPEQLLLCITAKTLITEQLHCPKIKKTPYNRPEIRLNFYGHSGHKTRCLCYKTML